jgi:hypothetical protein
MRISKDAGEALKEVPYVKAFAGVLVQIIEIREVGYLFYDSLSLTRLVQQILSNKDSARELIEDVAERSQEDVEMLESLQKEFGANGADLAVRLQPLKEGLERYTEYVLQ